MGLGGRREKQVIAADPRNTKWSNDTSNPGHKLLSSMGWKPEGAANEEEKKSGLMAHASSRRLRVIPIPKAGTEGIGYKPNGAAATTGLGALPSSFGGGSAASAASSIFSRMGSKAALQFVSAGASKEVINKAKTEGGEFAGLLQRLNAASSAANSATASPAPSEQEDGTDEQAETKEERRERRKRKRMEKEVKRERKAAKKEGRASAASTPAAFMPTPAASATSSDDGLTAAVRAGDIPTAAAPAVHQALLNPRMAARARHLASKRLLHSSAEAMAEILGIAPLPKSEPVSTSLLSSSGSLAPTLLVPVAALPASVQDELPAVDNVVAEQKAERKAAKSAAKGADNSGETVANDKTSRKKRKRAE